MLLKWIKRHETLSINLLFFLASAIYILLLFNKVPKDSFLIIHDHLTWVSKMHLFNESFLLLKDNAGLNLPVSLALSLPNRLIYLVLFDLGLNVRCIQIITFIAFLYLLQAISFFGIKKISLLIKDRNVNNIDILLITMFYCFNPLTIIYMSTGNFWNISIVLSYSLLPFLVFVTNEFFNSKNFKIVDVLILAVILFLSVLCVPFAIPIALVLLIFMIINFNIRVFLTVSIKKYFTMLLLSILMFSFVLYTYGIGVLGSYENIIDGSLRSSTSTLLRGGVLTMMLNYFSWTIYTVWAPRNFLYFHTYFESLVFIVTALSAYLIVILYLLGNRKKDKLLLAFVFILISSLFFAKGPQQPVGSIYNFLIDNIIFFQAVRSPDSKFALGVIFSLSIIFLMVLNNLKGTRRVIFKIYLILVILFYSLPLLTGDAIIGGNITGVSGDFIAKIYPEYTEAINLLNNGNGYYGVLVYPPSSYPMLMHDDKIFIGKDIVAFESKLPFYYLSYGDLTEPYVSIILKDIYKKFNIDRLGDISIKYVVIRKDSYEKNWTEASSNAIYLMDSNPSFTKVLSNKYLDIYEVPNSLVKPIISLNCSGATFASYEYKSPVRYDIRLLNLDDPCKITFMNLYSKYWRFVVLPNKNNWLGLFKIPQLLELKNISSHYPNEWFINKEDVDKLPPEYYEMGPKGVSVNLTMYFIPQFYFFIALGVSSMTLLACLTYIILHIKSSEVINDAAYNVKK
ncbi:MAG: hypothetical protein WC884_03790 [Candidatus Paceibacterota bacterium]